MATFTMSVTTNIPKAGRPLLDRDSLIDNSCKTEATIDVPVPATQSRHITVTYSNSTISSFTATISADTSYTLTLEDGMIDPIPANNTIFSTAVIHVRLTVSSDIFYSYQIVRTHTGTPC